MRWHGRGGLVCDLKKSRIENWKNVKTLNDIPLGATVRTTRRDGTIQEGMFIGFDGAGLTFEASNRERWSDIGPWIELAVHTESGWVVLPK